MTKRGTKSPRGSSLFPHYESPTAHAAAVLYELSENAEFDAERPGWRVYELAPELARLLAALYQATEALIVHDRPKSPGWNAAYVLSQIDRLVESLEAEGQHP